MTRKNNLQTKAKPVGIQSIEEWSKMMKERKRAPQLIEELLADEKGEYMVLAGRTGIGKTNLVLNLAFCLATGTPFFGFKCRKVVVAFVAFEGDPTNMADRYEKLKQYFPDTEGRLHFEMLSIGNPAELAETVFTKLKHTARCKVVILDPIKYIVPGDYLKPVDVKSFIQEFKELLVVCGVTGIVTLPIRKPYAAKGIIRPGDVYSIKGATEYVDGATSCLLVEKRTYLQQRNRYRNKSGDSVTLSYTKHRIATRELGHIHLQLDRDKCIFEPVEKMVNREDFSEITLRVPNE